MRKGAAVLLAGLSITAGTAVCANGGAHPHAVTAARAIGGSAAGAAIGQWRNAPHEWGQGGAGFAKRFGSRLGQFAVKQAITAGVSAWHHENLHYQPSNLDRKWPRVQYAVKSTFWVPRTGRAGKTVALGRISGGLGAGLISRLWQPASTAGIGAGFLSGGIGLGVDTGINVAREFWPRRRPAARHK